MFSVASVRYPSHLRDLADEDLIDHIDGGDVRVFEAIFDRHAAAAWLLAYRICGRRAMADDIVQEAFLSLWRSSASYDRARGSVRSWVLCVVHHRAVDALRRSLPEKLRAVPERESAWALPAAQAARPGSTGSTL